MNFRKRILQQVVVGSVVGLITLGANPVLSIPPRGSDISIKSLQKFDELVRRGTMQLSSNPTARARVDRIGQQVAMQCRRPIPWKFEVVASGEPNAFTLGEGLVVVTDGLMSLNFTDDELAGVLAHEVAHGSLQHLYQANLARELLVADLVKLKKEIDDNDREYKSGRMPAYVYNSRRQFSLSRADDLEKRLARAESQERFSKELSHEAEIEADLVGLRYATGAGFAADGLSSALEKLRQRGTQVFGKDFTGEGKSHPALTLRISLLAKAQNRVNP